MGNTDSSASDGFAPLSVQDEARLFESEKANRAVQVAEVTVLADDEKQLRTDSPFVPSDAQAGLKADLHADLLRTLAVALVTRLADAERTERVASDLHLDAMDELVRRSNARRADLDAELELSRRSSRWFVPVPEPASDSIAALNAELLRKNATALNIGLAEQERARRVEADLRAGLHEDLERHHARSGALLAIALEHLRRKSAPMILREKSLQDAMATVMSDLVRKCGVRLVRKQAEDERVERVAAELRADVHEAIIRRHAVSSAMEQEELELSRRCSTWFHAFPESVAATKNSVQEDLRRCFQVWAVTKEAQMEQQRRVAQENIREVNQAIESMGSAASSRVAEERERCERRENPRIPDDELSQVISEIHTALIRAVGVRDALAASRIEKQVRATAFLKNQFLLDIERLGNRRMAAAATDEEKARRLRQPAVIQDRDVSNAMVSAMSAMVRFAAVSGAISKMEEERQRRVTEDRAKSVHDELVRTVNRKAAISQMDEELKRRIRRANNTPAEMRQIVTDMQTEIVRSFSRKFAALEAEAEQDRRVAAHKFHDVKEELTRKLNQRQADAAMNLELSKQCASWFKVREEGAAKMKGRVQSDLVRTVNRKAALESADLERVRRVVENAKGDVFVELDRTFNRQRAVKMMDDEQKRRQDEPLIIAKEFDQVLSNVQSKIISKVGAKSAIKQAEDERIERIQADQKAAVQENLVHVVLRKMNSKLAKTAVHERQQLYKNRDPCVAQIHKAIVSAISG